MKASDYNRRELEEGRLTAKQVLAIVRESHDFAELVRVFQRAHGLDPDGKAGPDTRAEADDPRYVLTDVQPAQPPWGEFRIRPTTRAEAVANFLAWVGRGTYQLGGGADVLAESPIARRGVVDCSGLTAWCTGHNRAQPFGSLNTTGMIADASGPRRIYRLVERDEDVRPGDLIVRGWKDGKPGHTGGVVEVKPGFVRGSRAKGSEWWLHLVIVHAVGPDGRTPTVIKSAAGSWKDVGVIVRPLWYTG